MHLRWCFGFYKLVCYLSYLELPFAQAVLTSNSFVVFEKNVFQSHPTVRGNTKSFIVDIYQSANLNHVKNHSFINNILCVCCLMHTCSSSCTLSWKSEMDCKICYLKNNTHKPDSSITVFPRVRYRLEKVDAWHNCNHNQIAIHLKYFSFFWRFTICH